MATRIVYRIERADGRGPWVHLHDKRGEDLGGVGGKIPEDWRFGTCALDTIRLWKDTIAYELSWRYSDPYYVCVYRVCCTGLRVNPRRVKVWAYLSSECVFDPRKAELVAFLPIDHPAFLPPPKPEPSYSQKLRILRAEKLMAGQKIPEFVWQGAFRTLDSMVGKTYNVLLKDHA